MTRHALEKIEKCAKKENLRFRNRGASEIFMTKKRKFSKVTGSFSGMRCATLRWHNTVAGPRLEREKNLARNTQIRQKIVRSGA